MKNACQFIRPDGTRCTGVPGKDNFCIGHSPAMDAKRREGARRGGTNRSNAARAAKLLPSYLKPIMEELRESLQAVYRGDLPASRGMAMAAIATAILRLYEVASLEDRILELERAQDDAA